MMEWPVVDLIAPKCITCYEDYICFVWACKSSHLAASRTHNNLNGPPSKLPSLMLAEESHDKEHRELFLLSKNSTRKIQLPEAFGKVCRSSCGWLITVGEDFSSQLINPLSREIINLPKLDTFPKTNPPSGWDIAISKVVLVMESKLVLVIWGNRGQLGFCHITDNKWTSVKQDENNPLLDITFYNGKVYTFDLNNKIQACNVNGEDPFVLVDVAEIPEDVYGEHVFSAYIVGLDDGERKRLLVIIKEGVFNDGQLPEAYETQGFQVLAYDLESGNWSEVNDFGRKTLFVGFSSSFWIEDTSGVIRGNCIYYTDDELGEYIDSVEGGGRDMGIYHLSDGTTEPYFTGESRSHLTPPMWFQSV